MTPEPTDLRLLRNVSAVYPHMAPQVVKAAEEIAHLRAEVERLRRERNVLLAVTIDVGLTGRVEDPASRALQILDDPTSRAAVLVAAFKSYGDGPFAEYMDLPSDLGSPS